MRPLASLALLAALPAAVLPAYAHDVITTKLTFSKEIVRIFNKHCGGCHHDGGPAPFSLADYASARPWATAIKEEVLSRRMPPWGAVKGFGEFQNDRSLTQEEIHLIADWVEGGAPEGDQVFLPHYVNLTSPAAEPDVPGRLITHNLTLKQPITLHALRPDSPPPDNTKVTALLPTGELIPLAWFYEIKPKFLHAYWFRTPLKLPAGTAIHLTGEASIRLITQPRP